MFGFWRKAPNCYHLINALRQSRGHPREKMEEGEIKPSIMDHQKLVWDAWNEKLLPSTQWERVIIQIHPREQPTAGKKARC